MKKSSRQGFTLIELLAAIVILGIIVALSIPQISNLIDSNNEKKYETYKDTIETSAKLYTDAYTEDMFGNNESGCYDIPYEDLSNKNLVKDINVSDVTCTGGADKKTFVRVYKSGDHYNYKVSMYCTTKDGGTVQYENNIPSIDGVCDGTQMDDDGPTITLTLESGKSLDKWMTGIGEKVKVVVTDSYGLLENIKLKYAWSTSSTQSGVAASDWKTKSFGNERYEETVSFKASVPENVNDDLYLHIVPEMVRDANGNYTTESQLFGPFRLDNTDPTCELSLSAEPTGNDDWYVIEPTVTMVVNDEHGDIKNYGMTSKKRPSTSDYEKTKSKVQGDTTGVTWSGYVVDEAGNKTTCKTASFKVDTTPPTKPKGGSISLPGSTKEVELGKVKDSTDATSEFKEYRYLVLNDSTVPSKTDTRFKKSKKFTRDCGKTYYAYAIAIDNAGNISDVYKIGEDSDGADSYSEWGTCTKTCGTGTQTRTNTCALVTTELEQNCNTQECCSSVTYKDGTSCTKKCGSGTYNRLAYSAYDGSRCKSKDETSGGSACNTQTCCSKVEYEDGETCTKECGGGTYNRLAYSAYDGSRCESKDETSGGSTCNTRKCCSKVNYVDGTTCSKKCGGGTLNKVAYSAYDGSRCESKDETSGGSACNTQGCCDSVTYKDGTTCSKKCGGGTYNQLAYSAYDGSRCESKDETSGGSACNTQGCCDSVTYKDGTTCSKKCGGGTYNQLAYSAYDGSRCESKDETSGGAACSTQGCCSKVNYVDGTTCTKTCGGGTYNRLAYSYFDNSRCESKDETSGGGACSTQGCCDSVRYEDGATCSASCGPGTYNRLAYSNYDGSRCSGSDQTSGGAACNLKSCDDTINATRYKGCTSYYITTCNTTTCNYTQVNGSSSSGTVTRSELTTSKASNCDIETQCYPYLDSCSGNTVYFSTTKKNACAIKTVDTSCSTSITGQYKFNATITSSCSFHIDIDGTYKWSGNKYSYMEWSTSKKSGKACTDSCCVNC